VICEPYATYAPTTEHDPPHSLVSQTPVIGTNPSAALARRRSLTKWNIATCPVHCSFVHCKNALSKSGGILFEVMAFNILLIA
jgi:hypothetical protein